MLKSFPKIFIIAFLATLFFQISSAKAAESYQYYQKRLGTDCAGLGGQTSVPITACQDRNVVAPGDCILPGYTIEELCFCCYYNSTPTQMPTQMPTPASGGIKFTPQVGIPGAESGFEPGGSYAFTKDDSTAPIAKYIRAIYKYAIGIVGIVAAVVLMFGGVLWIVAGGNTARVGEAKAWIAAALTGLVLALTSYLILNTINPALVNLEITNIPSVAELKTGSCTSGEVCYDKYTKEQCDNFDAAFVEGGKCPICQWGVGSWNEFVADTCNDIAKAKNWGDASSWELGKVGECTETKPAGNHVLCCCHR